MSKSFIEQHYDQCCKYIEALKHPGRHTAKELLEITKQQRISEGLFMQSLNGRKNVAYPNLCAQRLRESTSSAGFVKPTRKYGHSKRRVNSSWTNSFSNGHLPSCCF